VAGVGGRDGRSKLDNTKALHHWFLYAMPAARPNGSTESCLPLHFDGPQMLAGWSAGANDEEQT